jgi:hypothetical protein
MTQWAFWLSIIAIVLSIYAIYAANKSGVSRSLCKKGLPFLHKIKFFQSKSDSNVSLTCPNPR